MSTKAIREALNRLRRLERVGDGEFDRIDAADVEVEAIERAAKVYAVCEHHIKNTTAQESKISVADFVAMEETMCAIARRAP